MPILLQVKDQEAEFVLILLSRFPFVKAQSLTPQKLKNLKHFQSSVQEVENHLSGKKSLNSAKDLLGEL
jgi:hypothetical protein